MKLAEKKLRKVIRKEIKDVISEAKADKPTLTLDDLQRQFSNYFGNDVEIYDGSRFIYINQDAMSGVGFNEKSLTLLMRLPGFNSLYVKSNGTIEYMFDKNKAMK